MGNLNNISTIRSFARFNPLTQTKAQYTHIWVAVVIIGVTSGSWPPGSMVFDLWNNSRTHTHPQTYPVPRLEGILAAQHQPPTRALQKIAEWYSSGNGLYTNDLKINRMAYLIATGRAGRPGRSLYAGRNAGWNRYRNGKRYGLCKLIMMPVNTALRWVVSYGWSLEGWWYFDNSLFYRLVKV